MTEGQPEGCISILNVGTKLLLKDSMDQYLRTLGDFKTFYAAGMASALRAYSENPIQILITEADFSDGSAYRLMQSLGGPTGPGDDDLYVILAIEERNDQLLALAAEMEVNSVLVKPFAANDLKSQIERFHAWKSVPREPWQVLVREAQTSLREKKFREAEDYFKQVVESGKGNPVAYHKAALYFLSKPDHAVAEMLLKKAIEIKPTFAQGLGSLASLYLLKGDLARAEEFLTKAQAASPLNPDRQNDLVKLYVERCVGACKLALKLDTGNVAARVTLGKLLAFQKDYVGAVRELEPVVHSLKDNAKLEAQTFAALSRKLGGLAKT